MVCKYFRQACFGTLLALSPAGLAFQPPSPFGIQPVLRADSALVLIPAHITTATGQSIVNLGIDNFRLLEDNVEQTITHFSTDDAPVSVGILFDASGSMAKKMTVAAEAVATFFKTTNPEDEFFLVQFNDRAKLSVPFTGDSAEVYQKIARLKPSGKTCLLDAVYLGLKQMKGARNLRKAVVILSDGGDNWSRHSVREVRNALLESDVQVYAMGIFDPSESAKLSSEERNGPRLLDELAEQSGGRHHRVHNWSELPEISAVIGNELRNEYQLGYYPRNVSRDGKYRQVKLKVVIADPARELRAYYRRGYYAPIQ